MGVTFFTNVEAIVGIEERIVDTLRGGHREYDVVVKLKDGTLQKIEIKAWDPKPKGVYNPNYMGDMLFFSLRGKTHKKLTEKDIGELKSSGLSAEELQDIVNNGGQLFEDLGQSLKKVINPLSGKVDKDKLPNIEHFWVFDGRVTSEIKADMVNRFIKRLESDDALFEVFKRSALNGINKNFIDDLEAADIKSVLSTLIKINS